MFKSDLILPLASYFYSHNARTQACKCMCAHRHTHACLVPLCFTYSQPFWSVLGQHQARFYLAHPHSVSGPVPNVTFSIRFVLYYLNSQSMAPLRCFSLVCGQVHASHTLDPYLLVHDLKAVFFIGDNTSHIITSTFLSFICYSILLA